MGKNGKSKNIECIAVTGPSASGKSMFARSLSKAMGKNRCVIICQDDYYKDWSHLPREERKKINFDDARAFDFQLLEKHISALKNGKNIEAPRYCFKQSKRLARRYTLTARRYVIVEGLMPFFSRRLRKLFDYRVYVEASNAVCLARRIKRDTKERGENIESVCRRYFDEVLPMQERYVEVQKKWADLILDGQKKIARKEINRIIVEIASLRSQ